LFWLWSPEWTWSINHRLTGFNEVMITYLLAIASQTHGVPAELYSSGWAGQSKAAATSRAGTSNGDRYENGHVYEGIELDVGVGSGGPLFCAHYSYIGFNPHERDRYTDYFENNRKIALINLAYYIRNPGHFKGYGAGTWGLTARTYWSWSARVLISARMICARDSVRVDDFAGGGKPALANENGPEGASRQCACQNQWHWCRSPRGCGNREFSGE
jgi:hypothetical protein